MNALSPIHELTAGWEYRRVFVLPNQRIWGWRRRGSCDEGFVEDLLATTDELHGQDNRGWRVVRMQAAEDDRGRCWLDVTLKRSGHADQPLGADNRQHCAA